MVRILAVIVALAVLLGGLWLLLGSEGSRAGLDVGPDAPREVAAAPSGSDESLATPSIHSARTEEEAGSASSAQDSTRERRESGATARDLRVRVVDGAGRPVAGLPLDVVGDLRVRVVDGTGQPVAAGVLSDGSTVTRATTDAQGLASFNGLRRFLLELDEEWSLVHDVAFEDPPRLRLTRSVLDEDPIVSVQPAFGAIEVRASELDGTRARDVVIELSIVRHDEGRDPLAAFERPSWERVARDGVARFDFVELGRDFGAAARREVSDVWSRSGGTGPLGQGQAVVLEVVLGADHPVLALRAVDRAGKPFASARLGLERREFFGASESWEVGTDERGVFTIDSEGGWIFGGELLVTHTTPEGVRVSGYAQLGRPREPGLQDGGDVVLEPAGVLVAGTVVDELGRGVEGARVAAGRDPYYDANFGIDAGGIDTVSFTAFRTLRFQSAPEIDGRSGPGGAFELVGQLPEDEFRVWAQDRRSRAEPVQARAGERDVVLVLRPVWVVSGRVLTDPGIPARELRLLRDEAQVARVESMDDDGTFRMEPVSSGVYDLVALSGSSELLRLEDLSVSGDTNLGELDLTGRMHHHEITLLGGDPASLRTEYEWQPIDGAAGAEGERGAFEGDRLDLWTPAAAIAVRLAPQGYRRIELERVSGAVSVRLADPLRVRLLLRTSGKLPRFPYIFDPTLELDGLDAAWPEGSPYWTEENDEVVFRVSAPGEIRVCWHLERRSEGMAIGGNVLSDHEVSIDVRDQPGEQVFEVELDGRALDELVERPPF